MGRVSKAQENPSLYGWIVSINWSRSQLLGSISTEIFEYTIPAMCKMWPNKDNTCQLKTPTWQLKANSTIASHTQLNVFYLMLVIKQSHISHTDQFRCWKKTTKKFHWHQNLKPKTLSTELTYNVAAEKIKSQNHRTTHHRLPPQQIMNKSPAKS